MIPPCGEWDDGDRTIDLSFADVAGASTLLLAVSGGPDSMALMHLAARWTRRRAAAPALHVATVDHGLRPEAGAEASMVAAAAAELGLPHAILVWTGPKPTSRLQERAREARYRLLAAQARRIGASHVLTAHHADDQAETVLFRLGRGSGVGGLAGMRRVTPLASGLRLARPLLDWTKAELVALCNANAVRFVDDPSNDEPAYARTQLRAAAPVLARLGLDTPGLTRLARRMARAEAALEAEVERVEQMLRPAHAESAYRVDLAAAAAIAPEIALRLVRRAVAHVVGDDPSRPIRLDRLEALTEALWAALKAGAPHRATLAGTRVALDGRGGLAVVPERRRHRGSAPSERASDRPD